MYFLQSQKHTHAHTHKKPRTTILTYFKAETMQGKGQEQDLQLKGKLNKVQAFTKYKL